MGSLFYVGVSEVFAVLVAIWVVNWRSGTPSARTQEWLCGAAGAGGVCMLIGRLFAESRTQIIVGIANLIVIGGAVLLATRWSSSRTEEEPTAG